MGVRLFEEHHLKRNLLLRFLGAVVFLVPVASIFGGEVTAERLNQAAKEPQNWLTYYGNYNAWRYSALDQIDRGNVDICCASGAVGG